MVVLLMVCTSVEPPVPPENPINTDGGSVTATLMTCTPSTETTNCPPLTTTCTTCDPVRNFPIADDVANQCNTFILATDGNAPSLTPTKFADGFPVP